MAMRTRMKERFGSWSFYKEALAIGIPVMLQALIQSLVSLIDSFMVADLLYFYGNAEYDLCIRRNFSDTVFWSKAKGRNAAERCI